MSLGDGAWAHGAQSNTSTTSSTSTYLTQVLGVNRCCGQDEEAEVQGYPVSRVHHRIVSSLPRFNVAGGRCWAVAVPSTPYVHQCSSGPPGRSLVNQATGSLSILIVGRRGRSEADRVLGDVRMYRMIADCARLACSEARLPSQFALSSSSKVCLPYRCAS